MLPLGERVRKPLAAYFATAADLAVATLSTTGPSPAAAIAKRARAALGTGEARELLEEAVSAGDVDPTAYGAFLAHLAEVAEAEVLSRRSLVLERVADDVLVLDGRERRTGELIRELRRHGRSDERAKLRALEEHFARDRESRREALAECEERGDRILSRGPPGPDEPPKDTRERCARFLAATHDAAGELSLRVRHPAGNEGRGLIGLLRALSPEELDPLVATKSRSRRLGSIFEALGLGRELARSISVRPSRLLAFAPRVIRNDGRAIVLGPAVELGLASERAFLSALARGLTYALASPATSIEHRHAPLGSAAQTIGVVLADAIAEPALASLYDAGGRGERTLRTAAACTTLLEARVACARALVTDRTARGDAEARDRVAIALGCDAGEVPLEIALPLRQSPRRDLTEARARLAALALVPGLRERYDADFPRNPRFADFIRGAAARGGTVSAETLVTETGGTLDDALRRAIEIAS